MNLPPCYCNNPPKEAFGGLFFWQQFSLPAVRAQKREKLAG